MRQEDPFKHSQMYLRCLDISGWFLDRRTTWEHQGSSYRARRESCLKSWTAHAARVGNNQRDGPIVSIYVEQLPMVHLTLQSFRNIQTYQETKELKGNAASLHLVLKFIELFANFPVFPSRHGRFLAFPKWQCSAVLEIIYQVKCKFEKNKAWCGREGSVLIFLG